MALLDIDVRQARRFDGARSPADARAAFATSRAVEERFEVAALASAPPGESLPGERRGLSPVRRVPAGIVHINDRAVEDEADAPFGGVRASGAGSRFGGREAFAEARWTAVQGPVRPHPF